MTVREQPLTIAIVTYNSEHQIADCVKMFANRDADITVRIRDNGSTDTTPGLLQKLVDDGYVDDVILSPHDAGFAIAANDVIRHSGSDDILLTDPDARIDLHTIASMRAAIGQEAGLGLVAPVVHGGAEISVMAAGRQPRLWPMITHYTGLSRLFPDTRLLRGRHLFLSRHSHEDQMVEWVSGCCLLVPRSTIDRVGLFTERWFMYIEDTEYCKRVLDAGLTIKVLAHARAFHEVGGSAQDETTDDPDTDPLDIGTMWARNLYDYYRREFAPNVVTATMWRLTFSVGNAARALVYKARKDNSGKANHLMRNAIAVWR